MVCVLEQTNFVPSVVTPYRVTRPSTTPARMSVQPIRKHGTPKSLSCCNSWHQKLARVSPRVELEVTFLIKSWASLEKMNMEPNLVPHPGIQRVGRRAEVHGGRGQPGGPLLLFCIHHLQGKHIQRDGDVLGMRCSSQLCWEDKTPTLPHNSPCAGVRVQIKRHCCMNQDKS